MLCLSSHRDTGVGSRGAWGAAAPLNAGRRGCAPPTNLHQWVSETSLRCEIKLPVVIHSGMTQKRIESFFVPAMRRTATVVQGKLAIALPDSWRMPRLHDTWRCGLCHTITCTAAPRVWHFSAFHYQMN